MKTVYINNLGYMASPYVFDATLPVDVTNEHYKKLDNCPLGYA
jgi:hypothetical protein